MLPHHEWLEQAKRLAIGMRIRVKHRNERRCNLIICNDTDKYWAYCQACKDGGVVQKEHVRFDLMSPEAKKSNLSIPHDLSNAKEFAQVGAFLVSKGMDYMYLPNNVLYSPSRKRILLNEHGEWHGRDITGNAKEKWLSYNHSIFVGVVRSPIAIVTEDLFSMYKVRWALRDDSSVDVLCALGTGIKTPLTVELLKAERVLWMFDGDAAGYKGAQEGAHRMQALDRSSAAVCAPLGHDPKDLECEAIRRLAYGKT